MYLECFAFDLRSCEIPVVAMHVKRRIRMASKCPKS